MAASPGRPSVTRRRVALRCLERDTTHTALGRPALAAIGTGLYSDRPPGSRQRNAAGRPPCRVPRTLLRILIVSSRGLKRSFVDPIKRFSSGPHHTHTDPVYFSLKRERLAHPARFTSKECPPACSTLWSFQICTWAA